MRYGDIIVSPLSANWPGKDDESLLWLASFPRSGNTFTRILLANYFTSGDSAFNINQLRSFITSDTSLDVWGPFSDRIAPSDPIETIWKARREAIGLYRKTKDRRAFAGLKTHCVNAQAFGVGGFDFRPDDRALYLVRHPLDVLLSFADFNGFERISDAVDLMSLRGHAVRGQSAGALEVHGSWSEHVTSWIAPPPCPLLLVRYEDLCADTETILRGILSFLGAPIVEKNIVKAVEASRFDTVRRQETARSFIERPEGTVSGRFFRDGKPLQWLRRISPEDAYRLGDLCGPVMEKLGYTHPRDVFFDGRNAVRDLKLSART